MKASSAERSTRMRERAQQSWPALPNTAPGAAAAAAWMSASANTTLADLPPSSSVTRLIVCAAPAAIVRPTAVEPVNATLATSGCSTSRCPQVRPGPATTLTTPSGIPASSAIRSNSSAVSGVSSAGLSTTVLPAASAGASFHAAIVSGKFQGVISATTPSGSRKVMPTPAGHGDRVPEVALRPGRVVAEGVDHHLHLAARVADRLAGVARLEHRQRLQLAGQRVGQPVQQRRAVARRDRAPGRVGRLGAGDRRVRLLDPRAGDLGQDRLGGGLEDRERHSRSNPRVRSQSVTAAPKARSSTSALLR